ncbi:MAG TPA: hypothetical protein VK870_10325 [Ignavibacteriaceae bacterium]|nr:hypothetical protein [Ignavibacteriaceae bacterium]
MPVKKTAKKVIVPKAKPKVSKLYYYRMMFDDNEKKNYMKSSLTRKQIERYMKAYEKANQKFINTEFVQYLKKYDKKAEIIEISDMSY